MNKFSIGELPETDNDKPVLYKVYFSDKYYLHKGKLLADSLTRFLDDVFRGIRGKKYPESYSEVVKHCLKYPSMYKVTVEVVFNGEPGKLLKKESALYKTMKTDANCLLLPQSEPYKPEWMLKQSLGQRCEKEACIKSGAIEGKKKLFKFCPNCGRLNK